MLFKWVGFFGNDLDILKGYIVFGVYNILVVFIGVWNVGNDSFIIGICKVSGFNLEWLFGFINNLIIININVVIFQLVNCIVIYMFIGCGSIFYDYLKDVGWIYYVCVYWYNLLGLKFIKV